MNREQYLSANKTDQTNDNTEISFKFKMITALVCLLIIVVTLILNIFFMESLYQLGVNIIYDAQHGIQSKFVVVTQNIFSMFCHPSTCGVLLVI